MTIRNGLALVEHKEEINHEYDLSFLEASTKLKVLLELM
jgi:hypothetical protein